MKGVFDELKNVLRQPPRGPVSPRKQWERENCKVTFPALLIYVSPIVSAVLWWDHWRWAAIPLMLLGVYFTRSTKLQVMALILVGLLLFSTPPPGEGAFGLVNGSYYAVTWYIRWYVDGQAHKRKLEKRDWEED